jgi:hypothetical protein
LLANLLFYHKIVNITNSQTFLAQILS